MCNWMPKLIFLITAVLQRNEDSLIMVARRHTKTGAGELCTELIVASSYDAFFRAVDEER